jgi:formate dehydrogenase subunit beta
MADVSQAIRDTARRLLADGRVDVVIGFEAGTLPLRSSPCFVRDAADADRLVWNMSCENNLARYLPWVAEKVGIVAKGCDARSVVGHLKEGRLERERVFIIGVPCRGMLDRRSIERRLAGKEVLQAQEGETEVIVGGEGFEIALSKEEFLHPSCRACRSRNPVIYDTLVGDPVAEGEAADEYADVREFEAKPAAERWAYFLAQTSKCVRCYACRNACPLCYCRTCFTDVTQPQWLGRTTDLADTLVFHIVRALHVAGRCVDCGTCDRACPLGVDVRKLTKKMEKDVEEFFHYKAGMSLDEPLPLATYSLEDPEDFVQ